MKSLTHLSGSHHQRVYPLFKTMGKSDIYPPPPPPHPTPPLAAHLLLLCSKVVAACVTYLRKLAYIYLYWNKKFLTCFIVFPLVVVRANTRIAIVLVLRYAFSTVLTRPTATRGLQRQLQNSFHGRIITTITS